MLFIYRVLPIGGIETFFLRMAKERHSLGKHTSILLLSKPEDSNQEILNEIGKYAQVLFPKDIFINVPVLSIYFPLLIPIKKLSIKKKLAEIDQVHVFDGMHALLGYRISSFLNKNLPITIGFYHYIRYLWGGNNVAFHEAKNREFIFKYLPKESLMLFNEGNRELYTKYKKMDFSNSNTFSMGVVDKKSIEVSGEIKKPLRIVAVGRLVEFKTYNLYMIDVIKNLLEKGVEIQFDIYGDGPYKETIVDIIKGNGVSEYAHLKGSLDYLKFDKTVAEYDLFIGSGTAIIQAAALGLPCIVGVENFIKPKSYGYFCDVSHFQYNRKGLDLPLFSVEEMILDFLKMNESDRVHLKEKHLDCIDKFTNESCQNSMNELRHIKMPRDSFQYSKWLYIASYVVDMIHRKINKNHPRVNQFEYFRNIEES
jgi:glycosyltransferase involved in cell wall biosynthesis